jgi:hypothetical protein
VNQFLANANSILQTAEDGMRAGHTPTDFVILLGGNGGIRMVADSDWSIEALQAEHGARTAYRVSMNAENIRVEGRENGRYCRLETEAPARAAQLLFGSCIPTYSSSELIARPLLAAATA